MLCSITAQYSKLNGAQILTRLLEVCDQEKVGVAIITSYNDDIFITDDGLECSVYHTGRHETGKILCYRVNQCICAELKSLK